MMQRQEAQERSPLTRRALLTGSLGGVAAALAAMFGVTRPVAANHAGDVALGHLNEADAGTQVRNTTADDYAFWVKATGEGTALIADTPSGTGVMVTTGSGTGVSSFSTSGTSVDGLSTSGVGVNGASDSKHGVHGSSNSDTAVWAQTASGTRPAVAAWAYQDNAGVMGVSGLAAPAGFPNGPRKTGVFGYAGQDAAAVGVRGTSPLGRGGNFTGGAAQIRLVPATNTGHPAAGQKGDLYVDSTGRLWFCKGAANWKQIA